MQLGQRQDNARGQKHIFEVESIILQIDAQSQQFSGENYADAQKSIDKPSLVC